MGKTRHLFKKIRDTKGTFHAKMAKIKYRNGMDLTEAEDIKKRWQEYLEELYKKIFKTQIITPHISCGAAKTGDLHLQNVSNNPTLDRSFKFNF